MDHDSTLNKPQLCASTVIGDKKPPVKGFKQQINQLCAFCVSQPSPFKNFHPEYNMEVQFDTIETPLKQKHVYFLQSTLALELFLTLPDFDGQKGLGKTHQ